MSKRNVLDRGVCVASALALLLAVMTSPIRPVDTLRTCSPPNCLRRNFAIPPTHTARHFLKLATLGASLVKAVRSENEEEKLSRASRPAWYFFGLLPSPNASSSKLITPGLIRVSQPLRC
jgi:hypothetical protein